MERYITFIRNNKTGEEFISMRKALPGAHDNVVKQEILKYPSPQYTVHTSYTDKELRDILETLDRWTGTNIMSDTTRFMGDIESLPQLIGKLEA